MALKLSTSLSIENQVILGTLRDDLDHYKTPEDIIRINFGDLFIHPYHSRLHRVLRGRYKFGFNWLLKILEIRNEVIGLNVDAIIVFEALVGTVFSLALFESKIPVIVSERVNPDPSIYEPHKIAQLLRPLIYKHGVVCSVQSIQFANWCRENWKINPVVTPNHLLEREYRIPEKRDFNHHFVSVGRYVHQTGYETLLASWQIVEANSPQARLDLFGAGNSDRYERMASELNLRRVFFHKEQEEMDEVYRTADCLISASRFEGFPNVVLEALAYGIPVIATESSPIMRDLEDKDAFQVVEIDNYCALAEQILKRCEAGSSLKTQHKAFQLAREYNWNIVGSSWYTALEQAVESKGFRAKRSA
jgi:glycosyltransferase involved in cell wall biosynthesis